MQILLLQKCWIELGVFVEEESMSITLSKDSQHHPPRIADINDFKAFLDRTGGIEETLSFQPEVHLSTREKRSVCSSSKPVKVLPRTPPNIFATSTPAKNGRPMSDASSCFACGRLMLQDRQLRRLPLDVSKRSCSSNEREEMLSELSPTR